MSEDVILQMRDFLAGGDAADQLLYLVAVLYLAFTAEIVAQFFLFFSYPKSHRLLVPPKRLRQQQMGLFNHILGGFRWGK